jgi:DUF971 family protein
MSTEDRNTAVEVRAPEGGRVLEIDWADGHRAVYPHEVLRGFCPCAHCQGHSGGIVFRPGGDLRLRSLEEVGHYALLFAWEDGHETGIYSFPYLRDLCACSQCSPGDPTARTFSR